MNTLQSENELTSEQLRVKYRCELKARAIMKRVVFSHEARKLGVSRAIFANVISYRQRSERVSRHLCKVLDLSYKTYFTNKRLYQ